MIGRGVGHDLSHGSSRPVARVAESRILAGMAATLSANRDRLGCMMEFAPGLLELAGVSLDRYVIGNPRGHTVEASVVAYDLSAYGSVVFWYKSCGRLIPKSKCLM